MAVTTRTLRTLRPLLSRRTRPRRILRGPLHGYRMVTSWHDYPAALLGYTEAPLLRWFTSAVRSGETWLDVGAHYGYTALALARLVGPQGRVIAFEPVPATAACLAETGRLNGMPQLHVLALALSDSVEVAPLEVALVRGMAERTTRPGAACGSIEAVSLDEVWGSLTEGDTELHGIKVDVQGMEAQALAGMASVLNRHRPLLAIELHAGVDRREVLELLRACGYRRPGTPVAPVRGEVQPLYVDDRTYVFSPGDA